MTGTGHSGTRTDGPGQHGKRSTPRKPASAGENPTHDPGTTPGPDEPHQHEPMRDPPLPPEHDPEQPKERFQGGSSGESSGSVQAPNPSPDAVVFDENKEAR